MYLRCREWISLPKREADILSSSVTTSTPLIARVMEQAMERKVTGNCLIHNMIKKKIEMVSCFSTTILLIPQHSPAKVAFTVCQNARDPSIISLFLSMLVSMGTEHDFCALASFVGENWVVATRKALSGQKIPREDNAKHCCSACSGFLRKPQLEGGLAIGVGYIF